MKTLNQSIEEAVALFCQGDKDIEESFNNYFRVDLKAVLPANFDEEKAKLYRTVIVAQIMEKAAMIYGQAKWHEACEASRESIVSEKGTEPEFKG